MPLIAQRFALPSAPAGEGGHAKLFKSVDLENDNAPVAVKVFNPSSNLDDRVLKAAWANELNAYQALGDHPNLARLIDWGRSEDGSPYLVFEWLEQDLFKGLDGLAIEGWDDFWPIAQDILSGLQAIHSEGYVHRDVKPENVLITENGRYKIADFGTARLAETVSIGVTLAPLGTIPYAPDERGTRTPTPSYDVYSFAVLTVVCLAQRNFNNAAEVEAAFRDLDLPPDIFSVLEPCFATAPDARPATAGVLYSQLAAVQGERELRRSPETEIFLDLPTFVLESHRKQYGVALTSDQVIEDIHAVCALSYDTRSKAKPDLQISGQTLLLRVQPHRVRPGVLRVARIQRPQAQLLEAARANWYRPKTKFRLSSPTDPGRADRDLNSLLATVSDMDSERAELEVSSAEASAFSSWRSVLDAKFALENGRGAKANYTSYRRDGSRIRFSVADATGLEVGEGRLVWDGNRRVLFGEVEGIENGEVILFVTKGRSEDLPRRGVLEFDSEASKSKLKRERDALERISNRRSVRSDLRDLLLDPQRSAPPQPANVESFLQDGLDTAKQKAVSASLGARDFCLVQGPPGTGKTTFIAELVSQQLRKNPRARIVLTSQTHIALDNALIRIREMEPQVSLLRLGRSDRLAQDVEPFSMTAQMELWRKSVLGQSRAFVKEFAARLGVDLDAEGLRNAALELQRRQRRVVALEQQIDTKQADRRELLTEIDRLNSLAAPILNMASEIENAAKSGTGTELAAAAERFIETGLTLAAQLEAAGPAGQKLVEMEATLAQWRADLKEQTAHQSGAQDVLAKSMNAEPNTTTENLVSAALERSNVEDPRIARLQEIASDWEERFGRGSEFAAVLVTRAQVVAATCVGVAGVAGADSMDFDLCIIDEASKATATEALVPLARSRRWVLVGDDRQLPPFVEQALEDQAVLSRFQLTRPQIRETLFSILSERLPDSCKFSLTHQHRMHPTIGRLVSHCFYGDQLTSAPRNLSPVIQSSLGAAAVWIDTSLRSDRQETRAGKSLRNKGEARVIASLLDRIQWVAEQNGSEPLSVAVLTGYEAQRREITETLAKGELTRILLKVRVATVDSYQGQEADISIFSVTRSNDGADLGFMRSEERVNVAVSRARDGLVIVGDAPFIESNKDSRNPLREILDHMRADTGCIVEKADKA
ncbi:serine/threonine-protein kinase [Streptomyces sp. NBC_00401]|uniref:serine/threonine-protein kinase n=1 Tax=Streptomyces sp. NBC_00401 TaxID=2975738 RepID=UPI0022581F5D|nr:serine/threonine-protein kinase [Streptomyces sp. NBC_00401]MCX4641944.1 AAA domain-containing protein [Streptomyces sp. NBC_01446]MCX5085617.1 AAA domain-containing protein [Streptomyces sp. NBC_00401]